MPRRLLKRPSRIAIAPIHLLKNSLVCVPCLIQHVVRREHLPAVDFPSIRRGRKERQAGRNKEDEDKARGREVKKKRLETQKIEGKARQAEAAGGAEDGADIKTKNRKVTSATANQRHNGAVRSPARVTWATTVKSSLGLSSAAFANASSAACI